LAADRWRIIMDISTKAASLNLKNPLMPGSGPLTGTGDRMIALAKYGLGALVTKTIAPVGAEVLRPCISGGRNVIYNSEAWSEHHSDIWEKDFFPMALKEIDTPIIPSLGYDAADMENLVPRFDKFADAFELIPRYVGKDLDAVRDMVSTAVNLTDKPVWVKMNAGLPNPVEFSGVARECGAVGIVAVTSLGPNMIIDLQKRKPVVGTPDGYVWTSGPYIKPLALATVHIIKQAYPDLSVIGGGGIANADDVLEFLLVGADAVQMLSWAMLRGKNVYKKIIDNLPAALKKYGFSSIEDVKSAELEKQELTLTPSFVKINHEKCTRCSICVDNCPYFALSMKNHVIVDEKACFGCGLCQSRCPVDAMSAVL
jgi:dihydroorotate dehydrogenase/ferredoxin